MFETSALNIRNQRTQRLFQILFLLMTALLILPVLLILGTLIAKGGPVISIDFLFTNPTDGMTAGGISLPCWVPCGWWWWHC
jgi:phosphate transport system permease protein